MNKTVSSVIDDINEWQGQHGSVWYVTAMFTDETVGSAGKKSYDAALEVQGLLREAIGQDLEFELQPQGQTKTGRDKFKILGFGTPGGAATYTAPGVQGNGSPGGGGTAPRNRSPEQIDDIRRAVALKAAASCVVGTSAADVLKFADVFLAWLSDASSAYGPVVEDDSPSLHKQAGASEDSGGGVATEGKEPAPSPHIHDWQQRQGLRGFLVCDCGETRKKESVT